MLLLTICGFAVDTVSIAQCVTPVITSIGNSGPVCEGGTINLTAAGTIDGVSASFIKMAGIGGNYGNQAFNEVFSSGDRAGSIERISTTTFNTYAAGGAAALRARYDVLLFTWASNTDLNVNWPLIDAYLALGGSVFWEDERNVGKLAPVVNAVQYEGSHGCSYTLVSPAPFPVLVANGVNGCFENHHERAISWPSWMDVYIKGLGGENFAIAGIYPTGGRGRFILQGPDQDYHASRGAGGAPGNQYKIILNQLDFLTAEQAGFSWTGPNGFTSNEANPVITAATAAHAGVYTATLTNLTGGGCFTTATTTVVVNSAPTFSCADVTASTDAGVCNAVVTYSPTITGATSTSYTFEGFTTGSGAGTGSGATFNKGETTVTITATNDCGSSTCTFTVTVTDNEAPVAKCKPTSVTLVNGAASIVAADINNGSTDNCGVQSVSVSPSTFSCANIGDNTVTLTVTDVNGNSATCTATVTVAGEVFTCSIASIPSDNTFTGGVATNLYLGYGPQSTTLQVSAPAGGAPYTYAWSPAIGLSSTSSAAPLFTPTAPGNYTFTVIATDKYGCSTTCSITICVLDIRVPNSGGTKVYVCHYPQGNTGNAKTMEISVNAVNTHIFNPGHGDRLGKCEQVICAVTPHLTPSASRRAPVTEESTIGSLNVFALPSPSSGNFKVVIQSSQKELVNVRVVDLYGRVVFKQSNVAPNTTLRIGDNFLSGTYLVEVMQGGKRKLMKVIKLK